MSDPRTPWRDPNPPPPPSGCVTVLAVLLGLVMLLPGVCTLMGVSQNPKILLPSSAVAPWFWLFLAIGVGGIVLISWATRPKG
jgi:hypothetical protein